MTHDVSPRIAIGRIKVPKASEILAAQLREQILDGDISEGAPLPAERELAERSGLSRTAVREALRTLEIEGLITTRIGRNGGSSARHPGYEAVARSVILFIRGKKLHLRSVLETREAIEPSCARLAALHRTAADAAELDALHACVSERYADIPGFLAANLAWHLAVVRASHNELLIAFMAAISEAVHAGTDLENFNSDEVRTAVIRAHGRITDAIRAGDAAAAGRRMARHVHAYADQVRQRSSSAAPGLFFPGEAA